VISPKARAKCFCRVLRDPPESALTDLWQRFTDAFNQKWPRPRWSGAMVAGLSLRGYAGLCRLALVFAFLDFFEDLGDESVQVAGLAAGHDALIGNDFAVFPKRTGIFHVGGY